MSSRFVRLCYKNWPFVSSGHLLNQGEAVHSLQRAVYNGMITAKHGRTMEELGAISGALGLLANIVMAWNTHHLQLAIDQAPGAYPERGARKV
jgi:TnpA family transposase